MPHVEAVQWQQDIRVRARARRVRLAAKPWYLRVRYWALGLALALHVGVLVSLRDAMRTPKPVQDSVMQIVFLDSPALPPMPQPPLPPVHPQVESTRLPQPTARKSAAASLPQSTTGAAPASSAMPRPLDLFNRDATIWQPTRAMGRAPTPQERAQELLQRGHNALHCRPTQFTQTYRYDESLGDRIARKYLVWVGLYGQAPKERLQRRLHAAAAACDGRW